ncbi:Uncharacterised protein [Morganella morganii]|nr:Uncharacterised protein [Morganella morganii]
MRILPVNWGADQTAALKNSAGVRVENIPSAEQDYMAFNTGNSANPLLKNPALVGSGPLSGGL